MVPIIRIVGNSGSGKTTVIEKLVAELKSRQYRVATIKHSDRGFEIDQPGKDSWRYAQAGSDAVIISSPQKVTVTRTVESDLSPAELSRFIGLDFDIIITEGYKNDTGPKIEVFRKETSSSLICNTDDLLAVATNEKLPIKIPQYSLEDAKGLVNLLEETLITEVKQSSISLFVNGEAISLNKFVTTIFSNILISMVLSLKRIKKPEIIDIYLKRISME